MKFYLVDAFATQPFCGAQSAVCLLKKSIDEKLYAKISEELNAPETIFIMPCDGADQHYETRVFQKSDEIKTVGHSLFAAAHIIWQEKLQPFDAAIYLETVFGIFKLMFNAKKGYSIELPERSVENLVIPDRLVKIIGSLPVSVCQNASDYVIELHSEEDLINASPDVAKLASIEGHKFILTTESDAKDDTILTRVFYPEFRSDEESVSLDCYPLLSSYWSERLTKTTLQIRQLSKRATNVTADRDDERVTISGKCITIAGGTLNVG